MVLCSNTGEVVRDQARQPSLLALIRNRPALGATDRQDVTEGLPGVRDGRSRGAGFDWSKGTIAAAGAIVGVGLRPGQRGRLAPPGRKPGKVLRHDQAWRARRSSAVMRASTAPRTSDPALRSMALQSTVLWMVAAVPRSIS